MERIAVMSADHLQRRNCKSGFVSSGTGSLAAAIGFCLHSCDTVARRHLHVPWYVPTAGQRTGWTG